MPWRTWSRDWNYAPGGVELDDDWPEDEFRCKKCGRYSSRLKGGNVVHNEVEGLDVCSACFRDTR